MGAQGARMSVAFAVDCTVLCCSSLHNGAHSNTRDATALETLYALQLDFAIVVVSVVVLTMDALLPGVAWLKGLRVLRALKPLRSTPAPSPAPSKI